MSIREENLNVTLAELLAERGLKALGEVILRKRGGRPEPDVLVELNGVRIVLEGKKPGMWNVLVANCQDRLAKAAITLRLLALVIPTNRLALESSLNTKQYFCALLTNGGTKLFA